MVAVERPALSSATDNEEHSIGGARMYKSRRGADQSFVAGTTDRMLFVIAVYQSLSSA
jgi:hypothetical protein